MGSYSSQPDPILPVRRVRKETSMIRKEVRARIEDIGVVPAVRVSSAEDARFAAESILQGGIPIVEVAMTVPGALDVIADLVHHVPNMIVGAGSVLDEETAHRCLDAGATFLTTDGLILEVVEYARSKDTVVFPGALSPTEVIAAWGSGCDFVKVAPCAAVGGADYIRALRAARPQIPLIAAGGVNQRTAASYIAAGAAALGVGEALIPWEAIAVRQSSRIQELARRFVKFVQTARNDIAAKSEEYPSAVRMENSKRADVFPPLQTV